MTKAYNYFHQKENKKICMYTADYGVMDIFISVSISVKTKLKVNVTKMPVNMYWDQLIDRLSSTVFNLIDIPPHHPMVIIYRRQAKRCWYEKLL